MTSEASTRSQTRLTGRYVRSTPGSQSLERGLRLLRTFRLGASVLTNAELASRSGLPRPTVSRLARSLVDAGFLAYDHAEQGYRLTAVYLSLALSYRAAQRPLDLALPLMRSLAEGRRINVGLAVLDQTDMVYLDSVRMSRLGIFRHLVPGSRIPAALTSLGRAYMASMPEVERRLLLKRLAAEHPKGWPQVHRQIRDAMRDVRQRGYCAAQWQLGSVAIATPIRECASRLYALNISFPVRSDSIEGMVAEHGELLMALAAAIETSWQTNLPA